MLDRLNKDTFSPHIGETFHLQLEADQTLPLTLVEVNHLGGSRPAGTQNTPDTNARTESFSVIFRGPAEPHLPQMMFNLHHDQMGTIPGLFLVPVAADAEGRYYEAVFN